MSSLSSSHSDCHCWQPRSTGSGSSSSSNDSPATPSLASGSLPSRTSSAASLLPFPSSEPEDYCRPVLSLNTHLPNHQRLAVLLPTDLWKQDSDADKCDTLACATRFTLFERKHHCRKCGGVFCQTCSSRTIPLLDTSSMPFVIPPAHLPLPLLAASSPKGALIPSRVCDDCHAQLSGQIAPSVLHRRASAASPLAPPPPTTPLSSTPALSHSLGSVYSDNVSIRSGSIYPPGTTFVAKPRHMRRSSSTTPKRTSSNASLSRRGSAIASTHRSASPMSPHQPQPLRQDYSELGLLAEYPLKVSSKGCKLTGGAWWNPKPLTRRIDSPVRYDAQVRRGSSVALSVREEEEPADECDEDGGAPPVVPIRRTIVRCQELAMREAPFASPELVRGKDCTSTF